MVMVQVQTMKAIIKLISLNFVCAHTLRIVSHGMCNHKYWSRTKLKRVTKKLVKPFFLSVKWVIVMLWVILLIEIFEVFPLI